MTIVEAVKEWGDDIPKIRPQQEGKHSTRKSAMVGTGDVRE